MCVCFEVRCLDAVCSYLVSRLKRGTGETNTMFRSFRKGEVCFYLLNCVTNSLSLSLNLSLHFFFSALASSACFTHKSYWISSISYSSLSYPLPPYLTNLCLFGHLSKFRPFFSLPGSSLSVCWHIWTSLYTSPFLSFFLSEKKTEPEKKR